MGVGVSRGGLTSDRRRVDRSAASFLAPLIVPVLAVNPVRPGRVEPRVVKRRPKEDRRLTEPLAEVRKKMPMTGFSLSSRHSGSPPNHAANQGTHWSYTA